MILDKEQRISLIEARNLIENVAYELDFCYRKKELERIAELIDDILAEK